MALENIYGIGRGEIFYYILMRINTRVSGSKARGMAKDDFCMLLARDMTANGQLT